MIPINYPLLARAVEFYSKHDFMQIEVPWMVDYVSDRFTRPDGVKPLYVENAPVNRNNLIASGEQGLIQLVREFDIQENWRCMTVTPCFRPSEEDSLHQTQFMKLELGSLVKQEIAFKTRDEFRSLAREFFISEGLETLIESPHASQSDLVSARCHIEVGSYGVRKHPQANMAGYAWVYATGLALPRFEKAIDIEKRYK